MIYNEQLAETPLALCDLPAALTERQRRGQEPLPGVLPLSTRLKATFATDIRALPAPTRRLLLLAALEADASLTTVRTAAQGHADVDDLASAQQADVLQVDTVTGRMVFRHPLMRSAIVQTSSPDERRSAHQALAAALAGNPEHRVWHLAEAATGPDEEVARALVEVATSTWRRCNPSTAGARGSDEAAFSTRRRVHRGGRARARR
ncbi:hypothetical protein [Dactylosporangium darangshiense]|uniref:hypothetical protein n=1 Tax=Dactylosporangium darangshiense TaxID=579108 RepID=UPI0031E68104